MQILIQHSTRYVLMSVLYHNDNSHSPMIFGSFLSTTTARADGIRRDLWIGLHDISGEGNFIWTDSSAVSQHYSTSNTSESDRTVKYMNCT